LWTGGGKRDTEEHEKSNFVKESLSTKSSAGKSLGGGFEEKMSGSSGKNSRRVVKNKGTFQRQELKKRSNVGLTRSKNEISRTNTKGERRIINFCNGKKDAGTVGGRECGNKRTAFNKI